VRIGGDLADAAYDGKRMPRGEKAAGVLLYYHTGREGGGYVTWEPSANVGLTLDTQKQRVAMFVAGPDSGSVMQIRGGDGAVELRSDEDGSRITLFSAGQILEQRPQIQSFSAGTCQTYKDVRAKSGKDRAMQACRGRFGGAGCRACLGEK
jgi:hypothetical protein